MHAAEAESHAVIRDPVCGMTVDPDAGKPHHDHDGRRFHFCSEGCRRKFAAAPEDYVAATDPVCGMTVDRASSRHMAKHQGERFHFCSARCMENFEADPEAYLGDRRRRSRCPRARSTPAPCTRRSSRSAPATARSAAWRWSQRACPPPTRARTPSWSISRRRFAVAAVLTVPLLVLAMGPMIGIPAREWLGERTALWAELALGTPVILWCGWPFLVRGARSFRTMNLNMFSLIAMGVAAAWTFSVAAVLFPGIFPDGFRDADGHVGVYFEAGAVIVALVLLGQILELGARERTGAAIRALMDLAATTARIVRADGSEEEIPLEDVQPATACACGRARRSRWTERWSRGAPRWTNPCSPASRCRWRRSRATR